MEVVDDLLRQIPDAHLLVLLADVLIIVQAGRLVQIISSILPPKYAPLIEPLSARVPLFACLHGLVAAAALLKRDHLINVRLLRYLDVV